MQWAVVQCYTIRGKIAYKSDVSIAKSVVKKEQKFRYMEFDVLGNNIEVTAGKNKDDDTLFENHWCLNNEVILKKNY